MHAHVHLEAGHRGRDESGCFDFHGVSSGRYRIEPIAAFRVTLDGPGNAGILIGKCECGVRHGRTSRILDQPGKFGIDRLRDRDTGDENRQNRQNDP